LAIITKSFLSGTDVSKTEIEELFQNAGGLISSLDSIVQEVKYEHYVRGTEAEYFLQMRLVKSIQSITQHLGGLRSSLQMQWNLTNLHPGQTRSSCGELFDIFVYYLGPPMVLIYSLCFKLQREINHIYRNRLHILSKTFWKSYRLTIRIHRSTRFV
jgi:hypothetical protein